MDEFLVILAEHVTPEQRRVIARMVRPEQSVSQRVFIARGESSTVAAAEGVERVLGAGQTSVELSGLSEAEDLFARGWLARQGAKEQRIGEGLDWDTPPMTPPARK